MIGALLLVLALQSAAPTSGVRSENGRFGTFPDLTPGQAGGEKIAEIRVHGNATLTDDAVVSLSGVAAGGTLPPGGVEEIEKRLRDSGRFDEVQVRKRYRTLAMDDVALVLLVHEKPGISPTGQPPSPMRRLRSRLMFFPIFNFEDGYGLTYGARTSAVNVAGKGTRLSMPLTWGGTRRAAVELDRTFHAGPFTRLSGSFGISQRENPFYSIDDRRTELKGRAERRLFDVLTLGADVSRSRVTFEPAHDRLWTTGADVTLDTRGDPSFPTDAVLASASWARLNAIGGTIWSNDTIDRYRLDGRGYKRLFGQAVIAVRGQYDTASSALPLYEQPLLGGSSLRGVPAGTYAGDKRLLWGAELRMPNFSTVMSAAHVGYNVFVDAGKVAPYGQRLADQKTFRSAGAGLFVMATIIQLNFEVAHSLDGKGTRFHFGTGFSF